MAKTQTNINELCNKLIGDIRAGIFAPVYLLMGDEPYYPELVCKAIQDNCLQDYEKDFNETVCYGADVTTEQVITAARRYPMMADRQLVIVKEAQMMKSLEELSVYCTSPLDSTVLVILMHKASADKRKSLYKNVQKSGVIVDSPALRDYEMPRWIESYYRSRGLEISPAGAQMLAEAIGTDISTIVAETDKLLKSLPEGSTRISEEAIEKNVGISRQFSVFELTKELSARNAAKALKIAAHLGTGAKFAMPMAVSALYTHFNRILKYGALLSRGGAVSPEEKAAALQGVNPYFYREYDSAVRNYPLASTMQIMSLLCEYDLKGKGGYGENTPDDQLLMELVSRILNA